MSTTVSNTESFSQVSVTNARLIWLRVINSLTSSILGAKDMTFANMILGTLGDHSVLAALFSLVQSITMQLFILLLGKVSFWIFNMFAGWLCKWGFLWRIKFLAKKSPLKFGSCWILWVPFPQANPNLPLSALSCSCPSTCRSLPCYSQIRYVAS